LGAQGDPRAPKYRQISGVGSVAEIRDRVLPRSSNARAAMSQKMRSMLIRRVTAVINASAAGVIETARKHRNRIGKVYAGRDGIIGALTEDLIDTSREPASAISRLKTTPGVPSAHAATS